MKRITKVLVSITCLVLLTVFATGCADKVDKNAIRQDQERMIQYVLENYELKNGDEIKKIKIIDFKKNKSSGAWFVEVQVNSNYKIILTEDRLGGEIRTSVSDPNEVKRVKDKVVKANMSEVEIEYN